MLTHATLSYHRQSYLRPDLHKKKSPACYLFFLQCYGHHRDLHSFPTRRSSDLHAFGGPGAEPHPAQRHPAQAAAGGGGPVRSEEHTSELQSQSNLVCRLLLEKKKPEPSALRAQFQQKMSAVCSLPLHRRNMSLT